MHETGAVTASFFARMADVRVPGYDRKQMASVPWSCVSGSARTSLPFGRATPRFLLAIRPRSCRCLFVSPRGLGSADPGLRLRSRGSVERNSAFGFNSPPGVVPKGGRALRWRANRTPFLPRYVPGAIRRSPWS